MKREERGGWRKPHNEDLHNWYSSPSTVTVIKSRKMRQNEHVTRIGKSEINFKKLVRKP
jgi:hypothetical protein